MIPQRPYLYEAIYQWVLDNQWTPYLLVDAQLEEVTVPKHLVQDGHIVLNISPSAIAHYEKNEHSISFSARFSGKSENIFVPFAAMKALYSKENSQGLVFPPEDIFAQTAMENESNSVDDSLQKPSVKSKKHGLKVVK